MTLLITDKDNPKNQTRLLRRKDAMELVGLKKSTFSKYVKSGVLPQPRFLGCTPVWIESELQALISNLPTSSATQTQ